MLLKRQANRTQNICLIILMSIFSLASQAQITKDSKMVKEKITNTVLIQTEKGPIRIELFINEAPVTTSNFINLVKNGFYNSTVFHRIVKDFVIQGGDPLGDGTGNHIESKTGKPIFIKLEIHPDLKFDRFGRVGMARTSDPNSASCQFLDR